jgi:hypothetical protein
MEVRMPMKSGNLQTTSLTPNSNCNASGSGDVNDSTTVQFYAPPNGVAWWTAMVSIGSGPAVLANDIGNGIVTFKQGLTVTLVPLNGGAYNVAVTGKIVDNGVTHTIPGQVVYMSTGTTSAAVLAQRA